MAAEDFKSYFFLISQVANINMLVISVYWVFGI